jgi:hypothetical protein
MDTKDYPFISIIVVNYNGQKWLELCIPSLLKTKYPCFEIIIVDNASSDNSVSYIHEKFPSVIVLANVKNLGYSNAVNSALSTCRGKFIAVLNNDIEVEPDWLEKLVNTLDQDDKIGIVAPKKRLMFDRQYLDGAGGVQNIFGYGWDRGQCELDNGRYNSTAEILHPPGAAFLMRRDLIEMYGFVLNPDFFYMFDDGDLGLRSWISGYKVIYVPDSVIYHVRGPSIGNYSYRTTKFMDTHVLASYYEVFGLWFIIRYLPLFFLVRVTSGFLLLKTTKNTAYLKAAFMSTFSFFKNLSHYLKIRYIVRRNSVLDSNALLGRFTDEIATSDYVFPYMHMFNLLLTLTGNYVKTIVRGKPITTVKRSTIDKFRFINHKPLDESLAEAKRR